MSRGEMDRDELDEAEAEYARATGQATPVPRADASMTLITSMMERPLDPGYAAAAQKREAAGLPPSTGSGSAMLLVWVLILGLIVGISTASLRGRDSSRSSVRADLIEEIQGRQESLDESTTAARRLQQQIDAASARLDPDLVGTRGNDLQTDRVRSGLVAVRGEGVRITLDDASGSERSADGDPRTGTSDEGRVRSKDLQLITNGLWAAGAEAIAINGQRLTARSAIRFAGEAILVNFRPLTRPYTIEAIGDSSDLQSTFAESSAGSYFSGLRSNFGINTSLTAQDELHLPSATNLGTRRAETIPSGATPTPTPRTKENS